MKIDFCFIFNKLLYMYIDLLYLNYFLLGKFYVIGILMYMFFVY